jgi:hypothetical protein
LQAGADGWYSRWENNGWRRVAAKTLREAGEDPVHRRTRDLAVRFHYSKVVRHEERVLLKKRSKREWLSKLYKQGRGLLEDELKQRERDEAKLDDADLLEQHDEDGLLEWSRQLDFDHYVRDWGALATSYEQRPE